MITPFRTDSGDAGRAIYRAVGILVVVLMLWGCNYGRMKDDEALQTYEARLPEMPKKSIPVSGGLEVLRQSIPEDLHNPVPMTSESVHHGKERFLFYCVQCHGPKANGYGTVGQSFAPLPTSLTSPDVLGQSDGDLFYKISLGFNRHPPLAATVAAEDRWAIINYVRFLDSRQ